MKSFKKKLLRHLLLILILINASSCEKLVTVQGPANAVDSQVLFSSEVGFESALRGMYMDMSAGNLTLMSGGPSVYLSLYADDLIPRSTAVNYQAFYGNNVLSSSSVVSIFWNTAYYGIYRSNLMLESLENATFLTTQKRNNYKAQALFMRALYHFYLKELFGEVPLVLSSNYLVNSNVGRTDLNTINQQIILDLENAVTLIDKESRTDKSFIDYYTIHTFLARIYLYSNKFDKAILSCDTVINSGRFVLEPLNNVFKIGSKEIIWNLTNEYRNVAEARSFVPSSPTTAPLFYLSPTILNAFDNHDKRKDAWIKEVKVSNTIYNYVTKYNNRNNGIPVTEYQVMFRLAEMYLVRSEAYIRAGKIKESLIDLNQIRKRAGLDQLNSVEEKELLQLVVDERQREFFCEWGHRWFDLRRLQLVDYILKPMKVGYKPHNALLPLPFSQIQRNKNLKQNEGYDE